MVIEMGFIVLGASVGPYAIAKIAQILAIKPVKNTKTAPESEHTHKTLMLEKELFPDWEEGMYTKCECSKCTYVYADGNKAPLVQKTNHKNLSPGTRFNHVRNIEGITINVPNQVPENAHGKIDPTGYRCVFTWLDEKTGEHMMFVVTTPMTFDQPFHYYRSMEGLAKPVQNVVPLRSNRWRRDGRETYTEWRKRTDAEKREEQLIAKHRDEFINKPLIRYPPKAPSGRGAGSQTKASIISTTKGYK